MVTTFYILAAILIVINLLPMVHNQHWIFRVWDFGRIQLLVLEIVVAIIGWIFVKDYSPAFYIVQGLLLFVIFQNSYLLYPYTPLLSVKKREASENASKSISIISANVLQFNTDFKLLIDMVMDIKPDMLLTIESNSDWEKAMREIEKEYPHTHKATLENTYGMHFYSKKKIESAKTHYFVADDLPSFEIELKDSNGHSFTVFGVHPPPPSPTEEETAKERDGDMMAVAKRVKDMTGSIIVIGDFNNVAWARSSQLFRRTSQLIDPRRGYGLVSTFHAKYKLLRVPIDLLFHSSDIFINQFKTLDDIGSDHFPMYCSFYLDKDNPEQKKEVEKEEAPDAEKVDELIDEGQETNGDREANASE